MLLNSDDNCQACGGCSICKQSCKSCNSDFVSENELENHVDTDEKGVDESTGNILIDDTICDEIVSFFKPF